MLGEDFNASELTVAMGRDRLEVLSMLERAEADTGIVRDLPEKDDWFHIPSFKRKIAADYFRVKEKGPDSKETPQVVRETHFGIAEGLEKLPAGNFETTQKIADHYYFSGPYYASKAVRSLMRLQPEWRLTDISSKRRSRGSNGPLNASLST